MATVSSASLFFGAGTGSSGTGASAGLGGSLGGLAAFQDLLGSLLGGGLGEGADGGAEGDTGGIALAAVAGKDGVVHDGTAAGKTLVLTIPAALLNATIDKGDLPVAPLVLQAAGEKLDLASLAKDGVPVQDLTLAIQLAPSIDGKGVPAADGQPGAGNAKPPGLIEIALPAALQDKLQDALHLGRTEPAPDVGTIAAATAQAPADLSELAVITLVPPRAAAGDSKPPAEAPALDARTPDDKATALLLVLGKPTDAKPSASGPQAAPAPDGATTGTAAPVQVMLEIVSKAAGTKPEPAADDLPEGAPGDKPPDDGAASADAGQAAMIAAMMAPPAHQAPPQPAPRRTDAGAALPELTPADAPAAPPPHPELAPKPPAALQPAAPEPEAEAPEPLAPRTSAAGKKALDSTPVLAPAAEPAARAAAPPLAPTPAGETAAATVSAASQGPTGDPGAGQDGSQDSGRRPSGGSELSHPQGFAPDAPRAPTASDFASQLSAASRSGHPGGAAPMPAVQQVAVHLNRAVVEGEDRLRIQLRPAELGRIDVQLHIADGRVSAHITADNASTLDLLQKDARGLEKALQDAGLQTDSGSLSFNLRDEGRQAHDNPGARHSGSATRFTLDTPTDTPDDDLPATRLVPAGRVDVRV
jgi:flagellar hook-length control protein FliK